MPFPCKGPIGAMYAREHPFANLNLELIIQSEAEEHSELEKRD